MARGSFCSPGDFEVIVVWAKNDPEDRINMGLKLLSRGLFAEAIAEFDKAISLNPSNPEYHNNKGLRYSIWDVAYTDRKGNRHVFSYVQFWRRVRVVVH